MSAADQVKQLVAKRGPWLIGGLGLAAVYFWYTRTPDAPAAEAGAGGAGGGYVVDPNTGAVYDPAYAGEINPRIPPTIPAPPTTPTDPAPADPADPPADPGAPDTNDEWIVRAIQYLMARLITADFAQSAIMKAMGGEPMTIAEMSAVSLAIAGLGPPPQGMPSMNAAPLPPPPGVPTQPPPPDPDAPLPPIDPLPPLDPEPAPPTPIEPVPPTPVPPVPPTPPTGKFVALTQRFLGVNMGTSLVLDKLARDHGLPGILSNSRERKVVNRTAIDRIWYAPQNAGLRAKYQGDWTKIKAGDKVWVPLS